jgi:L-histidine N-alpha-methyltransferase
MGRLDRAPLRSFLDGLRALLKPGDYFLVAADLVKDIDRMLRTFDDGFGGVAAFNRNILAGINRELGGCFEGGGNFQHRVKWNSLLRRGDLDLIAMKNTAVYIYSLGRRFCSRSVRPSVPNRLINSQSWN